MAKIEWLTFLWFILRMKNNPKPGAEYQFQYCDKDAIKNCFLNKIINNENFNIQGIIMSHGEDILPQLEYLLSNQSALSHMKNSTNFDLSVLRPKLIIC